MMKTRTWILLFSILLIVGIAASVAVFFGRTGGTVANIYQDGVCIRSIDLSTVDAPYDFTVSCDSGENTVSVERGRICIRDADCPDQVCVAFGWLADSAAPIVCLPHRLVIRIEKQAKSGGIDAVAR